MKKNTARAKTQRSRGAEKNECKWGIAGIGVNLQAASGNAWRSNPILDSSASLLLCASARALEEGSN
jgi:hypothetical protein